MVILKESFTYLIEEEINLRVYVVLNIKFK